MWNAIKAEKYQLAILTSMIAIAILIFINSNILTTQFGLIQKDFNQSKINYNFLNLTNDEIKTLNSDHDQLLQNELLIIENQKNQVKLKDNLTITENNNTIK